MIQTKLLPLALTMVIAAVAVPVWMEQDRAGREGAAGQFGSGGGGAGHEIERGPRGRREIALTLDAGGGAESFPEVLATLRQMNVKATFFLTGKWVQSHPQYADMLAGSGHAIGNHSWAHPEYTRLSDAEMARDLLAAEKLLNERMGRSVKPLFRPPFGDRDDRVLRLLGRHGYVSVYWTIDTLDSMEPRKSADFIARRVLDRTDEHLDGAIILSHVGYRETAEALPVIITKLRARGFHFVTLRDWPVGAANMQR